MITSWRCAVCGTEVPVATAFPWRCPGSTDEDRHHVLHVVDDGAGDSFMGGFVSGLSDGLSVRDAVLRGSAAAAMVVARIGCAPAMPTRSELEAFLSEQAGTSAA